MREYLKNMRLAKGLKQKDMAEKLGVSLSYYNLIENGERQKDFGMNIMQILSKVLEVDLIVLLESETQYQIELQKYA